MSKSMLIKIVIPKDTILNVNGIDVKLVEDAICSVFPGDVPKMFDVVEEKKCCSGQGKCRC